MIGKALAHYQITNQIGKGGIGEVFQVKDQILGRDVAITVLPDEFAGDTDRGARFQREAKLLETVIFSSTGNWRKRYDSKVWFVAAAIHGDQCSRHIWPGNAQG